MCEREREKEREREMVAIERCVMFVAARGAE